MKDTQMVKKLVGLESEVNVLKIEEERIEGRTCKIIHVINSKTRVRCHIVINILEVFMMF